MSTIVEFEYETSFMMLGGRVDIFASQELVRASEAREHNCTYKSDTVMTFTGTVGRGNFAKTESVVVVDFHTWNESRLIDPDILAQCENDFARKIQLSCAAQRFAERYIAETLIGSVQYETQAEGRGMSEQARQMIGREAGAKDRIEYREV